MNLRRSMTFKDLNLGFKNHYLRARDHSSLDLKYLQIEDSQSPSLIRTSFPIR